MADTARWTPRTNSALISGVGVSWWDERTTARQRLTRIQTNLAEPFVPMNQWRMLNLPKAQYML